MELNEINKNAKKYGVPIVRDNAHEFLKQVTKNEKPKHILEIGTAIGYSGIIMLESCDGDLLTIEHSKELSKIAKKNFKAHGYSKRAKVSTCDCLVTLARLVSSKKFDGYFDMIFLDGPKAQYLQMFDLLMILLKDNGTFIADNVLFHGYVDGTISEPSRRYKTIVKRLNEFIEICKNSKLLTKFELKNIDDGIIFAKKVRDEQK